MKYTRAMPRLAELNMSTSGLAIGNSPKINVRLKIWYPPSLMIDNQNLSSHQIRHKYCGALKVSPDFQSRHFKNGRTWQRSAWPSQRLGPQPAHLLNGPIMGCFSRFKLWTYGSEKSPNSPHSAPVSFLVSLKNIKISCWVLFPVKNEANTVMHSLNCIQGEIDENPADCFYKISVAATICRAALRERNKPTPQRESKKGPACMCQLEQQNTQEQWTVPRRDSTKLFDWQSVRKFSIPIIPRLTKWIAIQTKLQKVALLQSLKSWINLRHKSRDRPSEHSSIEPKLSFLSLFLSFLCSFLGLFLCFL